MKRNYLPLTLTVALGLSAVSVGAQSGVSSGDVLGYLNQTFQPGANWLENPFSESSPTLSTLIPTAPDGTTVSLWNAGLNQFGPAATFSAGAWTTDLTLSPGTGAQLNAPATFTTTFYGVVLNFDGAPYDGFDVGVPAPFATPAGLYLLGSLFPVSLSGHVFDPAQGQFSVFEAIIGRAPHEGEQVTTLDPLTQTYTTTTFLDGAWNNGDPSLAVGGAALFNLNVVPEPSAVGLLALGLGALSLARRRLPPRV